MKIAENIKEKLCEYIKQNEVVFQAFGNLVEVANENEKENKEELLAFFKDSSSVEVFNKGHWFIKDDFADLNSWAQENDVLFLLQNIGVLICVNKRDALTNKLIAA